MYILHLALKQYQHVSVWQFAPHIVVARQLDVNEEITPLGITRNILLRLLSSAWKA